MSILFRIIFILVLIVSQPLVWGYVGQRSHQLHVSQTNEEQFTLLSQKLIESQQAFSDAQPRLLTLADSFPSATTISQVVGRIEALADTKKVAIDLKSIEDIALPAVDAGKITTRRITAEVTGPIDSLLSFLEGMENQKEVLSIDSWDIVSSTVSSPGAIFKMTFRAVYYFYDAPTR